MEMDLPKQNKDIKITEAIKIFPLMFKGVLKVEKLIKVNSTPWAGHSLHKQALSNRQPESIQSCMTGDCAALCMIRCEGIKAYLISHLWEAAV